MDNILLGRSRSANQNDNAIRVGLFGHNDDPVVVDAFYKSVSRRDYFSCAADARSCDAVVAYFNGEKFAEKDFLQYSSLRCVSVAGPENGRVDRVASAARGVDVYCTPGMAVSSVVEANIALMFSLSRRIVEQHNALRSGVWKQGYGTDLGGKTIGIIGFGAIGQRLANACRALQMQVVVWTPSPDKHICAHPDLRFVPLPELMRSSDVVNVQLRLSDTTRGVITSDLISAMKPEAFFVNTARSELVDCRALYLALAERRIAAAALDVFEQEPISAGHPLLSLDNVVLTPHSAWKTAETVGRFMEAAVENIERALLPNRRPAPTDAA